MHIENPPLERRVRAMDSAPIGITIADANDDDYPMVYVNDGFVEITGYTESEAVGRNCRFLQGEETASEPVEQMRDALAAREETTTEVLNYRKDGTQFWNRVTISPVRDQSGTVSHFVGFQEDVTERRQTEQRLETQRDDLKLLNQMVRHDIRNDLQLIQSYADLLEDHVDDDGRRHLETLTESANNAVDLTDTAQDMASVMLQSDTETETISLRGVLIRAIDDLRAAHSDVDVSVPETIPGVAVEANEMLDSVFGNLLTNAVKHTDSETPTIQVSVTVGDDAVVSIADNGPGVPDEKKHDIFGRGEKGLDSEGSGIGLYLVRTLVEEYGGTVWVEDNHPRGAVFKLRLPTADTEPTTSL